MGSAKSTYSREVLSFVILLAMVSTIGFAPCRLAAAESTATNKSGSGTFVSFQDGTLTIKGSTGHLVYRDIGENYKTYQNNEEGPGSKLVGTVHALSGGKLEGKITPLTRVMPGTVVRVDVDAREICFGFDHRVIGTLASYQDGKLILLAAEAPVGFVQKLTGKVSLTIDPSVPVLESIDGGDLKYAGSAEKVLKAVKEGTRITARSQYDPDVIETIEIGEPKRRLERYIGQPRGPMRGTFASFKDGVLRIRGKPLNPLAAGDYERLVARRITDDIPILESIDGAAYRPTNVDALKTAREGTIVTIRKADDVIIEIQIGVANDK